MADLTRREEFAKAAMIGLLSQEDVRDGEAALPRSIAEGSVAFADALIVALDKILPPGGK